jgi:hypothetical protein
VVKDCTSVDGVLRISLERIGDSLPVPNAAVWTSISRLITKPHFDIHHDVDLKQHQVRILLQHTQDSLGKLKPKELATITLSIAKIVQSIREAHQRRRANIYHQALGAILRENNSDPNKSIFMALAKAADENLYQFEPRELSNLAYACALLKYNPNLAGSITLLENIADASLDKIVNFETQGIANMLWTYATLKVSNPQLLRAVGDNIASSDNI